jgi:hypothetical protein
LHLIAMRLLHSTKRYDLNDKFVVEQMLM